MKRVSWTAFPNAIVHNLKRRRVAPCLRPYKKVGIYKVDRLGDFVLSLGAINEVVKCYGPENVILIGSRHTIRAAEILTPGIEAVEAPFGNNRLWEVWWHIARKRHHPLLSLGVDMLLCLRHHRVLRDDMLLEAIPARRTIGADLVGFNEDQGQLLSPTFRFDELVRLDGVGLGECLEIAWNRSVVAKALAKRFDPDQTLPSITSRTEVDPELVAVVPTTSAKIKDMTVKQLTAVLGAAKQWKCRVQLLAAPESADRYHRLLSECGPSGEKVDVANTASTAKLIENIARCAALITVDTFAGHLAVAMDKHTICLLGGGHFGWFGPWHRSRKQRWLWNELPCYGCNWKCLYPEPKCLTGLDPRRVASEVHFMLEEIGLCKA